MSKRSMGGACHNISPHQNLFHLPLLFLITATLLSTSQVFALSSKLPTLTVNTDRKGNMIKKAIVTTQWYLYGRKHFRKDGYQRRIKKYTSPVQSRADIGVGEEGADGVDLSGKVIVITGANSGLGKEISTYAAAKNAKVYMVCRSKDRAQAAKDEIVKLTSNPNVEILLADVGEYSQVRTIASTLSAAEPKIHCLVCNAGALLNEKRLTSEGNESTIASHLIGGSYLLSRLLLPQLKAAGEDGGKKGRVIFTTSGGMYLTKFPSWSTASSTDSTPYDGTMAYAYAKRGQVLLAERSALLHPTVEWYAAHPGWSSTSGVEEAFGDGKKYLEPMRNCWEGAEGLVWLMAAEDGDGGIKGEDGLVNGGFYLDRRVEPKHLAGAFFGEGTYTKNEMEEVDMFMNELRRASGLTKEEVDEKE